jgi:hypothetical protein
LVKRSNGTASDYRKGFFPSSLKYSWCPLAKFAARSLARKPIFHFLGSRRSEKHALGRKD